MSGPSVSSLHSAALLSTLVNAPASASSSFGAAFVPSLPLLESSVFDRSALGVLGAPSAAALHKLCARINAMLEGGTSGSAGAGAVECFMALRMIASVAREAPAIVEASAASAASYEDTAAPSSSQHHSGPVSLRPILDGWVKSLFRLLKSLLDPRSRGTPKQGAPILPPLHPLLSLVAFETMLALLQRVVNTWADARKEVMNTTVPGLMPLLLKMISMADTFAWNQREQAKSSAAAAPHKPVSAATEASSNSNHAWPFPPPCGLERSLSLLVGFLREFKHSLRPFGAAIVAACTPLLGHENEDVRALAAEALASWSLVQSNAATASAKKKDAAAAAKNDGGEDDDADEEEEEKQLSSQALQQQQSQASRIVIPEDPWALMLQSAINTLHTKLNEMDAAGDYLPAQQQLDHASIAICTTATLAMPALPAPGSVVPPQPFLRAHALRNQLLGLIGLLEALLDRSIFSAMHSAPTHGSAQESLTIGVPIQSLLALLQRIFSFDLNAHTLLQITGRALSRPSLLAILPALYEAALGLLETLCLDFMGADATRPYVLAVAEMIKEMMQRYGAFHSSSGSSGSAGSKEEKHGLPRLVPRMYALASRLVSRFGGAGGLLGAFILPLLTTAQEDAERLVRVKNLQLQLNRNASSMQAFTGAALQKSMSNKEARRSSGGGAGAAAAAAAAGSGSKSSSAPDTSALFLEVHRVDLLSVAGVAALGFVHAVMDSSAASALPQQKRIQIDRSLLSTAMAVQTGSWKVVDAYRLALYRCLSSSMLIPVAASSSSGSSVGSTEAGMLATFSLLPYAVPVFRRAAAHDDAETVRAIAAQSLRLSAALVHPRALALAQRFSAFVQDAELAPAADDQQDLMHDEASANRLGRGLVRGRDGSLYMKMAQQQDHDEEQQQQQQAQENAEQQQQQQQADFAAPAAAAASSSSSSFHAAPVASSIPSAAPVAAAPLAGSKRVRDDSQDDGEAEPMQLDSEDQSAVHTAKRAHIDKPAPAVSVAASAAADSVPSSSVALVEDDEADADAAALTVADDGPDADEGEQGSLWNL